MVADQVADQVEDRVEVIIETDGLVVAGVARKRGDLVLLPRPLADSMGKNLQIRVRPLLRTLRDNVMVGRHTCTLGEEVFASDMSQARQLHFAGAATWLNWRECGEAQPKLRPSIVAIGLRVRALTDLYVFGPAKPNLKCGEIVEMAWEQAVSLVRGHHAEPIGWTWTEGTFVLVRTFRAGVVIDGREISEGQIALAPDHLAGVYPLRDQCRALDPHELVRIRATPEADCRVGEHQIRRGWIGEMPACVASVLMTYRLAVLDSDALPNPKSKR